MFHFVKNWYIESIFLVLQRFIHPPVGVRITLSVGRADVRLTLKTVLQMGLLHVGISFSYRGIGVWGWDGQELHKICFLGIVHSYRQNIHNGRIKLMKRETEIMEDWKLKIKNISNFMEALTITCLSHLIPQVCREKDFA